MSDDVAYDVKMLREDADRDEVKWTQRQQIVDIALNTAESDRRWDWPPEQKIERVEWPVFASDTERQHGLRLTTTLRSVEP